MPPVVRAQLDYYAVLEIAPSVDTAEVNAAFRRLAWRYHPDRNHAPGATLQFQDINEAHQVLIDPARRAEYDSQWHPRGGQQPRPSRRSARPHAHRRWHRHRHLRTVLLGLSAVLFVSSAWAVIFTAMNAAHSGGLNYAYDTSAPTGMVSSSPSCGFSMEIYPVSYVDEQGRVKTEWGTDVHNCYGGSTRIGAAPPARLARSGGFANGLEVR